MDRLRAMTVFVRSAELGSLSAAARSLSTTQPTVSKLIASLEASLCVCGCWSAGRRAWC